MKLRRQAAFEFQKQAESRKEACCCSRLPAARHHKLSTKSFLGIDMNCSITAIKLHIREKKKILPHDADPRLTPNHDWTLSQRWSTCYELRIDSERSLPQWGDLKEIRQRKESPYYFLSLSLKPFPAIRKYISYGTKTEKASSSLSRLWRHLINISYNLRVLKM